MNSPDGQALIAIYDFRFVKIRNSSEWTNDEERDSEWNIIVLYSVRTNDEIEDDPIFIEFFTSFAIVNTNIVCIDMISIFERFLLSSLEFGSRNFSLNRTANVHGFGMAKIVVGTIQLTNKMHRTRTGFRPYDITNIKLGIETD